MLVKLAIAAAVILGTVSSSLAMSKNAQHDVYVSGKYVGSDPDSSIRRELARDYYLGRD